ncbi:MAG: alpha-ketoglutarate-dependent dioxygenase AlkB [Actinomycetota bacterium]|jgi:alkylated DNA repair protein (DNA oxidative demethylase)|nr:alpha-ketoglutarate-dependent dioxygenase AlkB [Actinomycetota bacterium]
MRGAVERPEGLRYLPELLTVQEERDLLARMVGLAFGEVRMRGQVARRTVVHFGLDYDYESGGVRPGTPAPNWLEPVRARCAELIDREAAALAEVLLTRYPPGATIGWHRDAPAFGDVVGVSLGAACLLRFQRGAGPDRRVFEQELAPRSGYVLAGRSRTLWQHGIPPVPQERFSLTFRTLRRPWQPPPAAQQP